MLRRNKIGLGRTFANGFGKLRLHRSTQWQLDLSDAETAQRLIERGFLRCVIAKVRKSALSAVPEDVLALLKIHRPDGLRFSLQIGGKS